jgi:L-glutamine-phosphate cytidylyltransferase
MPKVFILNAGSGKRLLPYTRTLPKCLVKINKEDTILSSQLKALEKAGLTNVYILTGCRHDQIKKYLATYKTNLNIHLEYFPFYSISNNLTTLWNIRHLFEEDIIIINGDNVFDWHILKKLKIKDKFTGCLLAHKKDIYDDDDMLIKSKGSMLTEVGKRLKMKGITGESIGIMRFTGESLSQLKNTLEDIVMNNESYDKLWYLYAVNTVANKYRSIEVNYIDDYYWSEIDFPQDLLKVRKNPPLDRDEIPSIKELYEKYSKNNLIKSGENVDELWYSRLIGRKVSIILSWLFLHTNITPNQISVLSLLSALVGCILLSIPNIYYLIFCVVFFHLYIYLDSSDGEVARIKNQRSKLGAYLDQIFHVLIYAFLYSSLGINIFLRTGNINYLLLGIIVSLLMSVASLIYYQDPLIRELGYEEYKKSENSIVKFITGIYNLLTGDIEMSIIIFVVAPFQYLKVINVDIFLTVLIINFILILFGGICYNLIRKSFDQRYFTA